jgi:signal transduction histidine kinase
MDKLITIAAFLLLISFANAAHAEKAVIQDQAYAEDPTGKLDFAKARKLPLTPFTGTLLKGYTASAMWVRIRVSAPNSTEPLFLSVDPQFIDEIALYDPLQPRAPPVITGDRYPHPRDMPLWHSNLLRLHQQLPVQEYWLRVRATSAVMMEMKLLHPDEIPVQYRAIHQVQDTYTGVLLVVLLWTAIMLLRQRGEAVLLAFFGQQLTSLLMSLSYFGQLRQWFGHGPHAHWFDFTTSFLIIAITAATVHFHHTLLASNWPNNKHLKLLKMIWLPVAASFVLLLYGYARPALQLNMIIMQAAPFLLFSVAASTPQKLVGLTPPILPRMVMIAHYGLVLLLMSAISLSALGMLQIGILIDYRIVTLLSILVMLGLLQWRSWRMQHLEQRRKMRAQQLRQRISLENSRLEVQKSFASMLAHEVKTPLSVLRVAAAMPDQQAELKKHTDKAILEISAVIDRFESLFMQDSPAAKPVHASAFDVMQEIETIRAHKRATCMKLSGQSLPGFATDKALFRIIIASLMENAMKHGDMEKPKHIRVTKQRRGSKQGIAIEFTNAPGMAGFPDPDKLFAQFYRAPAAHKQTSSDHGLDIVKAITRALGGTIEYLPSPRRIRFRIWLPNLA